MDNKKVIVEEWAKDVWFIKEESKITNALTVYDALIDPVCFSGFAVKSGVSNG